MNGQTKFPGRYQNLEVCRRDHSDLVERLAPYFYEGDTLADAVVESFARLPPGKGSQYLDRALRDGVHTLDQPPPSLVRLLEVAGQRPLWLDDATLELGGATFMRAGLLGSLALLCYSLPYGYLSPGANKPLVFSGRLTQRAYRRLIETSRFVLEICRPGGLRRDRPGFHISLRVRLMHAQVRRLLLRGGNWKTEEWGIPINQVDMLGTNLLFSIAVLDGLRRCGLRFSDTEVEAVMHFWRYSGYLSGIDPAILVSTEREGWRILDLMLAARTPADDDSRELAHSLMGAGQQAAHKILRLRSTSTKWVPRMLYGISTTFIGRDYARELRYPETWWRHSVSIMRVWVWLLEFFRRLIPGGTRYMQKLGERAWERAIESGLRGHEARFELPQHLKGPGPHEPQSTGKQRMRDRVRLGALRIMGRFVRKKIHHHS